MTNQILITIFYIVIIIKSIEKNLENITKISFIFYKMIY